ncbi:MAG: sulfotransferase family 2 domain-containing protein [Paracoccaceae bacterium]
MPIVRAGPLLIYYAHVPKCAGSAIEQYLEARFGSIALVDTRHHAKPSAERWSRTSPQHLDLATLQRLFPDGFFDYSFAVVRHPVARIVSAYHFQLEIEQHASARMGFSAWLDMLPEMMEEDPFIFDNHTKPMSELVPEDAQIFHLEHSTDALVPWFDSLTNSTSGPRALKRVNDRKGRGDKTKVEPGPLDLQRIAEIYADDFERFGYEIDSKAPLAEAPVLDPAFVAERDAELARQSSLGAWLREKVDRVRR